MIERKCQFSPDRRHRYTLWRSWGDDLFRNQTKHGFVQFIGLNPSKADETVDDNTVTLCCGYARRWGYLEMCMTNLFAYRATNPKDMLAQADPVGVDNDSWLVQVSHEAALVVACWGTTGDYQDRDVAVSRLLDASRPHHGVELCFLRLTEGGFPHHPLRLPRCLQPQVWERKMQRDQVLSARTRPV